MDAAELTANERAVVDVLLADWQDLLRCTTIDQAMARVGGPFSHPVRLRVAEFLRTNGRAAEAMRWALPTYVLTNDEKLVARYLVRCCSGGGEIPPPAAAATGAQVTRETAQTAFEALRWLGFLVPQPGGWILADDPLMSDLPYMAARVEDRRRQSETIGSLSRAAERGRDAGLHRVEPEANRPAGGFRSGACSLARQAGRYRRQRAPAGSQGGETSRCWSWALWCS
jgi:hypothetical protein